VKRIGPQLDELLDDLDTLAVKVLGRVLFAESEILERPITQATIGLEIAAHLRLRSGDDASKETFHARGREFVQLLFHLRSDEAGSFLDGGLNRGTVETHLGHKHAGSGTPINPPAHAGYLFPVGGLDVIRIGQEILASAPIHGVIKVKRNSHIVFPGDCESIVDEPTRLLVGLVETEVRR
jgi:hypothetical protein